MTGMALGLLLTAAAGGQEVKVRSEVDARRIGVEDLLQLTITVEGGGAPQVDLPPLTNLVLAGGPSVAQQMSFGGGRMSQSVSWTWVLRPRAVGKAEVGAVTVRDQTAPAIPVEVVAGSIKPRAQPRRGLDPFGEDPFAEMFGGRHRRAQPKLVIEALPSRSSLYVGEPVVVTYYLYTQAPVTDVQFVDAPQYAGFWVEDVERPRSPSQGEAATLEGESYRRFPLITRLLFPTRAGDLAVPAATLRVGLGRQSFFDTGGSVQRSTKPFTLHVRPVPEEPGFSGAVGRFKASASLDRQSLPLGEAATLRFRVEGSGNLKWIDKAPELELAGAKVYPPQVKSDLKAGASGISGAKTWEFVVVPQTAGALEVPALRFSYFDPAAGKLVHSETGPLALRVEGSAAATGAAPAPVRAAAGEVLPLRADLDPARALVPWLGGKAVAALAAAVLLAHAGLWLWPRLRFTRAGAGGRAGARGARGALRELAQVGSAGLPKEQAAARIEKVLHDVFGALDGDGSERARAVA
ncbi:MAG TPA: BatD family protein, partial [Vicinamibacteria bacterium]